MGCKVSSYRVGGGMTSSTISVNFSDTAQKTVFTATKNCVLKLSASQTYGTSDKAALKLNSTNIGEYSFYYNTFKLNNKSLTNIFMPDYSATSDNIQLNSLMLYLEEGDTVYATRTSGNAFTGRFYSAVFAF